MGALTLMITGAGGYLGRATVAEARRRGHRVHAVIRSKAPELWASDPDIEVNRTDLAQSAPDLEGIDAVLHLAAAMTGDEAAQTRDTVLASQKLFEAAAGRRIVLAGSLSVYDGSPERIDENSPLEPRPELRDAYMRAKLAQEELLPEQNASSLRIGAIWGPDRVWNAHMGRALGPVLILIGRRGGIPLCHVDRAAEALVSAAETPDAPPVMNLLDDELPSREAYKNALRATGWPKLTLTLGLGTALALARLLSPFSANLPGLLRAPVLKARHGRSNWTGIAAETLSLSPQPGFAALMKQAQEVSR